jgi:TolB-like protein
VDAKMSRIIFVLLMCIFIAAGCAGVDPKTAKVTEGVKSFAFVDGSVAEVSGDMFTVMAKVSVDTDGKGFYERVTGRVIEKAFLLEGMTTRVNGKEVKLIEKRSDLLVFAGKRHGLKAGQTVKIYVPKKKLAVSSFKAFKNSTEDLGEIWLDGVTNSVVNTGQFIVVERSQLNKILSELKLELVGLTDSSQASKVGKMLNADMILTGSVNDIGGVWDVNLRLVHTATSVILAAINDKITYEELKPGSLRDSSPLNATFENGQHGFNTGYKEGRGTYRHVTIDSDGANGTNKSIKIEFEVSGKKNVVSLNSKKPRDLAKYKGVEFYGKADDNFNIRVMLIDENRKDAHAIDYYQYDVPLGKGWKKYQIPFEAFRFAKKMKQKIKDAEKGDTLLSLDLIREVGFVFNPRFSPKVNGKRVKKGSFWLDEIKFY